MAQRLGHHFADAFVAWEWVRKMAPQALTGHHLLPAFPYPMWLLDEGRSIYFANRAALAMERGVAADLSGGRLALRAQRADRLLGEWLLGLSNSDHGARKVLDARPCTSALPTWAHLSCLHPNQVLGPSVIGPRF